MKGYLKFYKGLPWIVKLIIAIFPLTGWINAFLYRFAKEKWVGGILAVLFTLVAWIVDFVCFILYGEPTILAK